MEGQFPYWLLIVCLMVTIVLLTKFILQYKKSNNKDNFMNEMKQELMKMQGVFKEGFLSVCADEIMAKMKPAEEGNIRIMRLRQEVVNDFLEANDDMHPNYRRSLKEIENHVRRTYPLPDEINTEDDPEELQA